jgi:formamidase
VNRGTSYLVACCQLDLQSIDGRDRIGSRVNKMLKMIEDIIIGYRDYLPVKLIVFPEFSISSIPCNSSNDLIDKVALPADNEFIDSFVESAAKHDIVINLGTFIEKRSDNKVVFNTSITVDKSGPILSYRKLNPFIPLEPVHSPHDLEDYNDSWLPVANTEIGSLATQICYDVRFPEMSRVLGSKGAELIMVPSAFMEPWGVRPPTDVWSVALRGRAIENSVFVVGCSLASSYSNHPPFSWSGGSMIVDYEGRIVAQAAGNTEQILVAPINIDELRSFRESTNLFSPNHLRTEIYKDFYAESVFPPKSAVWRQNHDISQDSLRKLLNELKAKRQTKRSSM